MNQRLKQVINSILGRNSFESISAPLQKMKNQLLDYVDRNDSKASKLVDVIQTAENKIEVLSTENKRSLVLVFNLDKMIG